ncbi:hypothetical protein Tco_0009202 [Tanacetum coccineum]
MTPTSPPPPSLRHLHLPVVHHPTPSLSSSSPRHATRSTIAASSADDLHHYPRYARRIEGICWQPSTPQQVVLGLVDITTAAPQGSVWFAVQRPVRVRLAHQLQRERLVCCLTTPKGEFGTATPNKGVFGLADFKASLVY